FELMEDMYFKTSPPKTTGREKFGEYFVENFIQKYSHVEKKDLITTVTYFTAYSISTAYHQYLFPYYDISEIIVRGEGANNMTLISMIEQLLPDKCVTTLDRFEITNDEKEAVGFAILANETLHQKKPDVPYATGDKK